MVTDAAPSAVVGPRNTGSACGHPWGRPPNGERAGLLPTPSRLALGASQCGCWSKSGSSSVTPRQKQEAATGGCGHGGWTLPQATHAHGSVPTASELQVEGGAQDR